MLSNIEKGKIVLLRERGDSYLSISIALSKPLSDIKSWHKQYLTTGKL